MRAAVRDNWIDFNHDLEGILNRLYADERQLVTTGMGNLVDPMAIAMKEPWENPDGTRATRDQIQAAWLAVKNDPLCASKGWRYAYGLPANKIRLSDAAVQKLIFSRLDANDALLAHHFPDFAEWPAAAQLAAHSMTWALGFGKLLTKFPRFCKALLDGDFQGAAAESRITGKGSIVERSRRNKELLFAAALVGGDPEQVTVSWAGRTPTVRPPAA